MWHGAPWGTATLGLRDETTEGREGEAKGERRAGVQGWKGKAGEYRTPVGGFQAKFQLTLSVAVGLLSFKEQWLLQMG